MKKYQFGLMSVYVFIKEPIMLNHFVINRKFYTPISSNKANSKTDIAVKNKLITANLRRLIHKEIESGR